MKSLQDLQDTIKRQSTHHWSPGRRREGGRAGSLFKEMMAENFPNLGRHLESKFQSTTLFPRHM